MSPPIPLLPRTTGLGEGSKDNGLGYQHCTTPLGPCTISPVAVNRMTNNTVIAPGYVTTYGGTLLKRASGWLVLSAMSTHGNSGGIWALAAMTSNGTSPDPAVTPYSAPTLLLYPESDRWHPHPCEFYPCFADTLHVRKRAAPILASSTRVLRTRCTYCHATVHRNIKEKDASTTHPHLFESLHTCLHACAVQPAPLTCTWCVYCCVCVCVSVCTTHRRPTARARRCRATVACRCCTEPL